MRLNFIIFNGLAALSLVSSGTAGAPPTDLTRPASTEARVDESLLSPWLPHSLAARLRALSRSQRPSAPAELASLLQSARALSDEEATLLAVRALAPWTPGSVAARRALTEHLRDDPGNAEPGLRKVSRSTAAMALAWSGQDDAVRPLLLLAQAPKSAAPQLSAWARAALLAYPPREAQEDSIRSAFELPPRPFKKDPVPSACQWLPLPPKEGTIRPWLIQLTQCAIRDLDVPPERWRQLQSVAPATAQRALSLLIGRGLPVQPWMVSVAREGLRANDAVIRSAAAWLLAITAPTELGSLLQDPHAEVRAAALNQVLAGVVAGPDGTDPHGDLLFLSRPSSSPPDLQLAWLALPALWEQHSTLEIERLFISTSGLDRGHLLAAWASRVTTDLAAPGPAPATVGAEVQAAPAPERAQLVFGLGSLGLTSVRQKEGDHGENTRSRQALGLLRRQYDLEGHPGVRRLTCVALAQLLTNAALRIRPTTRGTDTDLSSFAQQVATFDPDPTCRALFAGSKPPFAGSHVFVAWTSGPGLSAPRHLAPPLYLRAAPDGFVGATTGAAPARSGKEQTQAVSAAPALFSECPSRPDEACDWPELTPP